jgi:hypothetical protein
VDVLVDGTGSVAVVGGGGAGGLIDAVPADDVGTAAAVGVVGTAERVTVAAVGVAE